MEDKEIVDLYWQRSDLAISETNQKYGRYCYTIAYNICGVNEDAEECVSDTWLRAWNLMPDQRPTVLSTFLGRITRNYAINLIKSKNRIKRGGGEAVFVLDELEECIPSEGGMELPLEMRDILNRFLEGQTETARKVFLRRYWFGDSVKEIAQMYGLGESRVKMTLLRSRTTLRQYLEAEGVSI